MTRTACSGQSRWDAGGRGGVIPGCVGGVGYRDTATNTRTVLPHRDTWDLGTYSPLQAQCSPVSTTSTMLTSVHYKHNTHLCPLQSQCSPVSTTSTMLTCVHVFSESTLASNSALGMGPSVVSTALRREVQVGGKPLHRPLCQICNAFSPPISLCIRDSTSTQRTPRLMGSSHFGTSFQTASNPISEGV